jgi:hypothetical protein
LLGEYHPFVAGGTDLDLDRPRGALRLIGKTVELYRRFPLLFAILAGTVVVPYELIVLLVTGHGPLGTGDDSFVASQAIALTSVGLLGPLVSALHVHAVREIGDGNVPRLTAVAKRSLVVLPTACAAVVIAYLGAAAGLLALIVPGVLLYLRWAVVAQAAALEGGGWKAALRRSADLTAGHYPHVFALLLLNSAIAWVPSLALRRAVGGDTTVGSFVVGTALEVVLWSFGALAVGLLFFDLRARLEAEASRPAGEPSHPSPSSVDPGNYSDEDRPPGWYVNPDAPWRMRYWAADGKPGWSRRTTKTPKQTLAEWRDLRWTR